MKLDKSINVMIPAAGKSSRMGKAKLLLPWGSTTVIGHIIKVFSSTRINEIYVVIDSNHIELNNQLEILSEEYPIKIISGPGLHEKDMRYSIQIGLETTKNFSDAILISLGDQPQIQPETVKKILSVYREKEPGIIVPSFNMRRGHPWLLNNQLFDEFLMLEPPSSPREFLKTNQEIIHYVEVDNDSILQDIDTPLDYLNFLPMEDND
ncbi:NTP transferase domain-containing protein [Chloroflexota bacterium]